MKKTLVTGSIIVCISILCAGTIYTYVDIKDQERLEINSLNGQITNLTNIIEKWKFVGYWIHESEYVTYQYGFFPNDTYALCSVGRWNSNESHNAKVWLNGTYNVQDFILILNNSYVSFSNKYEYLFNDDFTMVTFNNITYTRL